MSNQIEKLLFMVKGEVIKDPDPENLISSAELLVDLLIDVVIKANTDDLKLVDKISDLIEHLQIRDKLEEKKSLTPIEKLTIKKKELYLKALNGKEEGQVNGYLVTYKPQDRFALDSEKLKNYFHFQLGIDEEEMRNQIYSHSLTKPSLKLKTLK